MMEHLQLNEEGYKFIVHENFPSHSGLGSGTQLSLAVGKLISDFTDNKMEVPQIAHTVGRGGTSGIGVASFDNGGFIIDGDTIMEKKLHFYPLLLQKHHLLLLLLDMIFQRTGKLYW